MKLKHELVPEMTAIFVTRDTQSHNFFHHSIEEKNPYLISNQKWPHFDGNNFGKYSGNLQHCIH